MVTQHAVASQAASGGAERQALTPAAGHRNPAGRELGPASALWRGGPAPTLAACQHNGCYDEAQSI